MEQAGRTTYVLVDGENIDATLGTSILGRRPRPEERPRWERLLHRLGSRLGLYQRLDCRFVKQVGGGVGKVIGVVVAALSRAVVGKRAQPRNEEQPAQ